MELTQDLELPEEFSLQQLVLYSIVKTCWVDVIFGPDKGRITFCAQFNIKLISHREAVLIHLNERLPLNYPKMLRKKLNVMVVRMQQGFSEVVDWEKKFMGILPGSPYTIGTYADFINPEGHFNDLALAKYFVADGNQSVDNRFGLACCYCFEKDIVDLWQFYVNRVDPQKYYCLSIYLIYIPSALPRHWENHLENKRRELLEREMLESVHEYLYYDTLFYVKGLRKAIKGGYEYAASFFWALFSESEKAEFLRELDSEILYIAAMRSHTRVVYFIYSLLSLEQKSKLISWMLEYNKSQIWLCLLRSSFYESVLKDILTFPNPIPTKVYKHLLSGLAYTIKELKSPVHKEIFKRLIVNHLLKEQKNEVLDPASYKAC